MNSIESISNGYFMIWFKYLMIYSSLILISFHVYSHPHLLCEKDWWESDSDRDEIINMLQALEVPSDLFQLCNENLDRPIHIGLKLEQPLSENQITLIAFLAYKSTPRRMRILDRNRQGETPLLLIERRLERTFANAINRITTDTEGLTLSPQKKLDYVMTVYQNHIAREITLYMLIKDAIGNFPMNTVEEIRLALVNSGIREIDPHAYFILDDIFEQMQEKFVLVPIPLF